ncbi:hypothetical protein [Cryobacterium melibiosiphilum]|uniref:hypothetical protein n=1 Tax=Cryobacterium melibiosiphilum TaxID=995039 RepID=UPI001314EAE0|nr:hypothetical protein [Cryobacterium melibiosiphilum]
MTEPMNRRVRRAHPARNARVITGALSAMALMGMVAGFQVSASAHTTELAVSAPLSPAAAPAVPAAVEAPVVPVPVPDAQTPAPAQPAPAVPAPALPAPAQPAPAVPAPAAPAPVNGTSGGSGG